MEESVLQTSLSQNTGQYLERPAGLFDGKAQHAKSTAAMI